MCLNDSGLRSFTLCQNIFGNLVGDYWRNILENLFHRTFGSTGDGGRGVGVHCGDFFPGLTGRRGLSLPVRPAAETICRSDWGRTLFLPVRTGGEGGAERSIIGAYSNILSSCQFRLNLSCYVVRFWYSLEISWHGGGGSKYYSKP